MTSVKTIISALCLAACTATAPALAKPISILGTWTIVSSTPAPWVKPGEPPLPSDEKELLGRQIVFSKNRITAPSPPLNPLCRNPNYEYKNYPFGWLFEGNLPEPQEKAAAELGFKEKFAPGVSTGCEGVSDFGFLNNDTALFGLNNRIYRIERKKR
jgi:hypothetical protein